MRPVEEKEVIAAKAGCGLVANAPGLSVDRTGSPDRSIDRSIEVASEFARADSLDQLRAWALLASEKVRLEPELRTAGSRSRFRMGGEDDAGFSSG